MHVQIQHNIDFTYINSFIWNSCDIIFDITLVHYIMTVTCINTCTYLSGFIHQVQQILVHPDRQELGLSVCRQLYTVGTVSGSVLSFILKIIWRLNIYLLLQVKWFIYKTFAECRLEHYLLKSNDAFRYLTTPRLLLSMKLCHKMTIQMFS